MAADVAPGAGLAPALVWSDQQAQPPPRRDEIPPPGQPRPVLPMVWPVVLVVLVLELELEVEVEVEVEVGWCVWPLWCLAQG